MRDPSGDRNVIEGLLGRGRSGAVYLVKERRLRQNLFAHKEVIDPNKRDRERFIFEGEILKRLDHRALPRVYRVFEHEKLKRVYVLMDYIKGSERNAHFTRRWIFLPILLALFVTLATATGFVSYVWALSILLLLCIGMFLLLPLVHRLLHQ